jgi:hypothetical protein
MVWWLVAYGASNLMEYIQRIPVLKPWARTFGVFERIRIALQLVHGFVVFIFFNAVMHYSSTRLKICDTIFKDRNPDCYASIHRVIGKVEPTDRASIYPAPLLLQFVHKLDCLYLGSSRNSARRKYRTESVEPGESQECDDLTRRGTLTS